MENGNLFTQHLGVASIFDIPEIPPNKVRPTELRPWLNRLRRAVLAARIIKSADILPSTTEFGTTLKSNKRTSGGGGNAGGLPFEIVDASTTAGTPAGKIKVGWGTVQDVTPTLGGTGLDAAPEYTFSSANTYNVYLKFSGGACTVEVSTSAVPTDDTSYSYCLIGIVTVAASGGGYAVTDIKQNLFCSFKARKIGSTSTWIWTALANVP